MLTTASPAEPPTSPRNSRRRMVASDFYIRSSLMVRWRRPEVAGAGRTDTSLGVCEVRSGPQENVSLTLPLQRADDGVDHAARQEVDGGLAAELVARAALD